MSEETVVKLKYPITYTADRFDGGGERTVEELRIPSRIKVKHLRAMDKSQGEVGKSLALIAAVTGLPKAAIDEMDAEDLAAATDALSAPLSGRPETGAKSSE